MVQATTGPTAREYSSCWEILQREGEQSLVYLQKEFTGALATDPAVVEQSVSGDSCRH